MQKSKENKKMNKKGIITIIISILVILLIIVTGVIIYKNNSKVNNNQSGQQENQDETASLIDMNNTENAKIESGVKENTSENISKDRKLGNLSITDIKLSAQDGVTSFTATVKNNTSKDFAGGVAKITFTNKDGNTYAELEVYIPEMKTEATNSIDASTTADIANAYNFSIELEK